LYTPLPKKRGAGTNQEDGVEESAPQDQAEEPEEEEEVNQDNTDTEMMVLTANAEIIGGRSTVCRNIFDAIMKCVIQLIPSFHKQRLDNEEVKRIKTG
jgi:hypothetical protein